MKRQRVSNKLFWNMFIGLVVVLIILYGINVFTTNKILSPIRASIEEQRPANLHLTLITNDCKNCYDMNNLISFIKQQNVKIIQEKKLLYSDKEAQNLVSENKIKSLPALIITGETSQQNIVSLWNSLGVMPIDNVVVISDMPPYYSLSTKKVVGLVQLIKLTDDSCSGCYDVETHMQILPRFGVYVDKSSTYDVSSSKGKELLQKYNITKVPTIILSADASVYPSLVQVWGSVGTIESDDWYVFRDTEQMGNYTDLTTGKIVII